MAIDNVCYLSRTQSFSYLPLISVTLRDTLCGWLLRIYVVLATKCHDVTMKMAEAIVCVQTDGERRLRRAMNEVYATQRTALVARSRRSCVVTLAIAGSRVCLCVCVSVCDGV